MTAASMATTVAGSNDDLNDPIAWALRVVALTVDNPVAVDDDDVSSVPSGDFNKFLDYAEYRLLNTILSNLDDVDLTAGPIQEAYSDFPERIQARIDKLDEHLSRMYGQGQSTVSLGWIEHSFAEHGEEA